MTGVEVRHRRVVRDAARFDGIGIRAAGEWRTPQKVYENLDPSTGGSLGSVADATAEEVDAVVSEAMRASVEWRRRPAEERAEFVLKIADEMIAHGEELARLEAVDSGNPVEACRFDVRQTARILRYMAGLALELKGETIPTRRGVLDYTLRQPFGVVGRITAFNHPVLFAGKAFGAPLVAGNTVVIKPSPWTPLSPTLLVEVADRVLPRGVVGLVTGGRDAAIGLARSEVVRRISFVGSVSAGLAISRTAAEVSVKHISMELGGKNPLIVFPDADPAAVGKAAVDGMNFGSTAGQSCGSTSRLLLHDAVYDDVLSCLVDELDSLRLGLPLEPSTTMGPLVSSQQLEKTQSYVRQALDGRANLVAGGHRVGEPPLGAGYFHEPTVIGDVESTDRLACEEVFGPVLAVLRWSSPDEALRIANALPAGLTAAVWTNDLRTALTFARDVEAGYVWVNGVSHHQLGAPFGGVKDSGTSRADWLGDLHSYTQIKNVNIDFA